MAEVNTKGRLGNVDHPEGRLEQRARSRGWTEETKVFPLTPISDHEFDLCF